MKLVIEYDGTAYCGWQRQVNAISVQQVVEEALRSVTGEKATLYAAGRTDAGVHALGQVAHFDTESSVPPEKFSYALNSLLPDDVRIKDSARVPGDFHARFDAKWKHYRYCFVNGPHMRACGRQYVMQVPSQLDMDKMRQAAMQLVGTHDFWSFTGAPEAVHSTVRTIYSLDIRRDGDLVQIDVVGNGFLYNMVRIIVGTLIHIGLGKLKPEDIPGILESRDRRKAGVTAKPQGLFLVEVGYEEKKA